jgi:hypothetical protein
VALVLCRSDLHGVTGQTHPLFFPLRLQHAHGASDAV